MPHREAAEEQQCELNLLHPHNLPSLHLPRSHLDTQPDLKRLELLEMREKKNLLSYLPLMDQTQMYTRSDHF